MPNSQRYDFDNGRGQTLTGRLELPAGEPRAYAIFAHCFTCSKNVRAATLVSRALAGHGIAVLRFDFTGLGNSDGDFGNTDFSSNVEDLVAAASHLAETHTAPALLVGHSLGGAAVLAVATEIDAVKAVATIGAPSEPAHVVHLFEGHVDAIREHGRAKVLLAGREFEVGRGFLEDLDETSLKAKLASLRVPVAIFHSPIDELVSIDHARRIYEAAHHPKSFVSLDGADHMLNDATDAGFVGDILGAWAKRYIPLTVTESETPEGRVVVAEEEGLRQRIVVGRHELTADEPVSAGGTDAGPTPYDLLLASLGTCTSMTLRLYANRKRWPLEGVTVALEHDRVHRTDCDGCEDEPRLVDRIRKTIRVRGDLDDAQLTRLAEIADRCPVHRTLRGDPIVETTIDHVASAD